MANNLQDEVYIFIISQNKNFNLSHHLCVCGGGGDNLVIVVFSSTNAIYHPPPPYY